MCVVIQETLVNEHIIVSLFCSILLNFEIPNVNNFLANSEYAAYFDFLGMSVFNQQDARCYMVATVHRILNKLYWFSKVPPKMQ
jgi:hypothetical protein